MRAKLRKVSYMDIVLPNEMEINILTTEEEQNLNSEDLEVYYYEIEEYCRLTMMSNKWHNDKISEIKLFNKQEKKNLSSFELKKYRNDLKQFYISTTGKKHNIKRLSNKKENQLSDEEYCLYLKELRIHDDCLKINNMPLEKRLKLHPILRQLFRTSRIGIKIKPLNTKIPENIENRPIIFVVTHVGKDDIAIFNEYVHQNFMILSGDYESLHNNIEGFMSMANGTIFFDMKSKIERVNVEQKVGHALNMGFDILCSMEAAWNLTPNEMTQDIFDGMLKTAYSNNALILPIGIERFNKKLFGINFSSQFFDPLKYSDSTEMNKSELELAKNDLRNTLSEIKYNLYFDEEISKKITEKRENIGDYETYYKKFKEDILKGWTFTEDIIEEKKFRNRQKPKYAFSYLKTEYKNLDQYYRIMNDVDVSSEIRYQISIKFREKIMKLISDINNPVYPNEIHNILLQQFEYITNTMKENNDELICLDKSKKYTFSI